MRPLTGSGQAGLNSYRLVFGKPVVAEEIVFNGGLSYDETGVLDQPGTMAIPPCAKIEDIEKKHDPTVLPLFHMLCCRRKTGGGPAEALDYIVNASGLAQTGEIISLRDRLILLFEQVDRKTSGRTPPPGREMFSKS